MTPSELGPVPPGWYPDPGGERQWRVWTGRDWSSMTRPYGDPAAATSLVETLGLVTAVHRLARYGVVALFAGLGLVVSVATHGPGSAHALGTTLAATLLSLALGLLAIGSASYALAGRELVGRWSPAVLVPGLNVVVVSSLISRALGETGPLRRVGVDVALIGLYLLESGPHPYLAVAPALVSWDLTTSLARLGHQLVGAPAPASRAS
ncbi:MAG: hypothetical protein ACHQFZ_10845 [Acidimicrobiales bacterium]